MLLYLCLIDYNFSIQYEQVRSLAPNYGALAFLDLSWGTSKGRVYVRLNKDTEWGHQFLQLCTGENGRTFAGTQLIEIYNKGSSGECIIGGLISDFDQILTSKFWRSSHYQSWIPGLMWGGSGSQATQFGVTLRHWPYGSVPPSHFGWVEKGLNVLQTAVLHPDIREVLVTDCGVILPDMPSF